MLDDAIRSAVTRPEPKNADEHYDLLPEYAATREKEGREIFSPFIEATDKFGKLISRLIYLLGDSVPVNAKDAAIRDVAADIFDFLYKSRSPILSGELHVAYPLMRRAFESLCLLHACILHKDVAEKWENGKKFDNRDLRKILAEHPMGESKVRLKELYGFFSRATHPNREMLPSQRLGRGNKWVLGAISMPEPIVMVDHCMKVLEMWFWMSASVTHHYKERLTRDHREYMHLYYEAVDFEEKVYEWLVSQFNRLLPEAQAEARKASFNTTPETDARKNGARGSR